MGRASKLLRIAVDPALLHSPEVRALREKGHLIEELDTEADLILHPKAWRMEPALMKYIDAAVKAARAVVYPTKAKAE